MSAAIIYGLLYLAIGAFVVGMAVHDQKKIGVDLDFVTATIVLFLWPLILSASIGYGIAKRINR
jgi:hypothetical protein